MDIRVLLADDDEGIRMVLRNAIKKSEGYTIVGEAEDGEVALRLFEELRPDVVFLDVEMPLVSGVECAKRIADINPRTVIVFATAHERYMPEAFEVYAFDYLVKPFKLDRLNQTLKRIKEAGNFHERKPAGKPAVLPEPFRKLMIRNRDSISLIDMRDILLIQREEKITAIYTSQERYTTSEGLSELEERLDKNLFLRCHKSYIINKSAISKIYPYGRWTYIVKLNGTDKDALMTRDKYEELEKLFR